MRICIAAHFPSSELSSSLLTEESGFARAELSADLARALAQLPAAQRELLLLRYAHELKLREIAEITGQPLRTVQSRLRTALRNMKNLM